MPEGRDQTRAGAEGRVTLSVEQLRLLHEVTLELSACPTVDEVCRRAIELGRQRLGFDRLGIWFRASEPDHATGMFGVDEEGNIRDERGTILRVPPESEMGQLIADKMRLVPAHPRELRGARGETVGEGMIIQAAIWNGREVIGYLAADNLIAQSPLGEAESELLALFAAALGHQCANARMRESVRENEERYRRVIAMAHGVAYERDWKTNSFTFIDAGVEHLTGYTADEMTPDLFEAAVQEQVVRSMPGRPPDPAFPRRSHDDAPVYQADFRLRRRDGTDVWLADYALQIRDEQDRLARSMGILQDITYRREAEQRQLQIGEGLRHVVAAAARLLACEELEDVCRLAVEIGRDGLLLDRCSLLLTDGTVLRGTFAAGPGCTVSDDRERSLPAEDVCPQLQAGPMEEAQRVVMGHRWSWEDGGPVVSDGHWLAMTRVLAGSECLGLFINDAPEARTAPDLPKQGIVAVYCSLIASVLQLKRADEERRQLLERVLQGQKRESLGLLAGGVAHEFNNILMGVMGSAALALRQADEGSAVHGLLEDIQSAAAQAAALAQTMLTYSGKGRFVAERADLSALVDDIGQLLTAALPRKVRLTRDLTAGLPPVEADPSQIQQVVLSLVTNAAEALCDDEGQVMVSTYAEHIVPADLEEGLAGRALSEGQHLVLEVADTGEGMDEVTRSRIFDPFFSTRFPGRGMGLAAALGIVESHGGALAVRTAPGEGTTIRVLFPVAEEGAPAVRPAAPESTESRRGRELILVADDEEFVRDVIKAVLTAEGYPLLMAEDGRQAVDLFNEHADEIALVLLDMTMPKKNGQEVFQEITALRPDIPVLLSSGYSQEDLVERFGRHGPHGFLQKPYHPDQLTEAVERILSGL